VRAQSLDLFPVRVSIFDFEDAPRLNRALLDAARTDPELRSSITGKSIFAREDTQENAHENWWVAELRQRYDAALSAYLAGVYPERKEPFDLEAYGFFNYNEGAAFTPVHDHLIEADLVAIYYAHAPQQEERHASSYYAMHNDGVLVLHDPRPDARIDRRGLSTRDHYRIYPRTNRLVIHPAYLRHSVAPSDFERLAVTCTVTIDRKDLFDGYVRYQLGAQR